MSDVYAHCVVYNERVNERIHITVVDLLHPGSRHHRHSSQSAQLFAVSRQRCLQTSKTLVLITHGARDLGYERLKSAFTLLYLLL